MRATERLLEVIEERQGPIRKAIAPDGGMVADAKVHSEALDINEAVTELRRRGDAHNGSLSSRGARTVHD
jgi:hypothetical protein